MEEKLGQEIIRQLREIREVMIDHSAAYRGHKAKIQRLIGTFDKAQKAMAEIRKETDAAKLRNWASKVKTMNFGLQGQGLGNFK